MPFIAFEGRNLSVSLRTQEQGRSLGAGTLTIPKEDYTNTSVGIRLNSYIRQEDEKDFIHIWSANRPYLEDVTALGVAMGPRTANQMTNESVQMNEHEIQDNLTDFHLKAAIQLAQDSGWTVPEDARIIISMTCPPQP
eukprot:2521015-Heterocapsa_arctica.AAC.1